MAGMGAYAVVFYRADVPKASPGLRFVEAKNQIGAEQTVRDQLERDWGKELAATLTVRAERVRIRGRRLLVIPVPVGGEKA